MNRRRIIYIGILLIVTVIVSITTFSYAFLTRVDEEHGKLNMVVGSLDYKIESDDLSNNSITLGANESKEIELTIRSLNKIDSKYKLYTNSVENVIIGYLDEEGFNESTGTISANGTVKVKIVLDNTSNTSKTITFGVQGGFEHNTIALLENRESIPEGQGLCTSGIAYEFSYTGNIQEYSARCPGIYKLETWGAEGGSVEGMINYSGGKGGYSKGEITLTTSQTLYVVVGGRGNSVGNNNVSLNDGTGYNGGGPNAYQGTAEYYGSGGGGATHIATSSGTLSSLSSNTSSVLIVAGGGGGSSTSSTTINNETTNGQGGYGGGLTGGNGTTTYTGTDIRTPGTGGTQTTIGVTDSRTSTYTDATFGSGCLVDSIYGGYMRVSGGGGYYGGGCGIHSGGGGGSSYIGGVTNGQTIAGNLTITEPDGTIATGHSGNGYARITYLGLPECQPGYTTNFDYTGNVQEFTAKCNGTYKLETWGAQGGTYSNDLYGGYGGYSTGTISLLKNQKLYVVVGQGGQSCTGASCQVAASYNGGANCMAHTGSVAMCGTGGGATHIATSSGVLSSLENNRNSIIMVSGGGGAAAFTNYYNNGTGGHAGGYIGSNATNPLNSSDFISNGYGSGGTQTAAGRRIDNSGLVDVCVGGFGQGGTCLDVDAYSAGAGGGGYYGGGASRNSSGGGGSSYIGNSLLSNKKMVCYNCTTSTDTDTYTETNTCTNATATANCSKTGNGYAKITYIGD